MAHSPHLSVRTSSFREKRPKGCRVSSLQSQRVQRRTIALERGITKGKRKILQIPKIRNVMQEDITVKYVASGEQ